MKFSLATALFCSIITNSPITCNTAEARSLQPTQREVLQNVVINGEKTPYLSEVTLDFVNAKIKIEIVKDVCGHYAPRVPGMMRCMAMPVTVATLEASIDAREVSCGSVYYKASDDQTPRDGLKTTLQVADHSRRLCKDLQPTPFAVRAQTLSAWTNTVTTYELSK